MDEITSVWNPVMQTIQQAREYLEDESSDWTNEQQQEVESTIVDIEQMLELVSSQ